MKLGRLLIPVLAVLALGAFAASANAAKGKSNLKVSKLEVRAGALSPGGQIAITATVSNKGRATSAKSETTFLLSTVALKSKSATILQFRQKVGKLKKKKSAKKTTAGAIPASIAPGTYFVGACADGGSKVKESKETDNCAFAKTPITVSAFPTAVNTPPPVAAETPTNTALPSISGAPAVGRAVTGDPGTWTPAGTFLLRSWLLCTDNSTLGSCAVISGAEGPTYTPVAGDANNFIRLRVTGTNVGGSSVATSAATAAVVPDSDADGTPDDTDCAPSESVLPGPDHPGFQFCGAGIYDARDGTAALGSVVYLGNALVSGVKSVDDGTIYVQVKPGDPAYEVTYGQRYSGIEVSGAFGRQAGDRLNIWGILSVTSTGYVLGAETIEVVSTANEATSAAAISFTEFLINFVANDAALLSLPSITITSIDSAGWHLDLGGTPMIVDKTLIGTLPAAVAGQNITTLIGIAESHDSNLKLMPRTSGDIGLDPGPTGSTGPTGPTG